MPSLPTTLATNATGLPSTTTPARWPAPAPKCSSQPSPHAPSVSVSVRAASCSATTARSRWLRSFACSRRCTQGASTWASDAHQARTGLTAAALAHGPGALGIEHYPGQVGELLAYLAEGLPEKHPFHRVHAMPEGPTKPEVWVLGSSLDSAHFASHFGCPYSFAHFIQPAGGAEAARVYRDRFEPGAEAAPRVSVGVSVQVAETEDEARFLAGSRFLWWVKLLRGQPGPFPTPEEAETFDYTAQEREMMRGLDERAAIGTPAQVREKLEQVASSYEAEELVGPDDLSRPGQAMGVLPSPCRGDDRRRAPGFSGRGCRTGSFRRPVTAHDPVVSPERTDFRSMPKRRLGGTVRTAEGHSKDLSACTNPLRSSEENP